MPKKHSTLSDATNVDATTLKAHLLQDDQLEYLRSANVRLTRQLAKKNAHQSELIHVVREAAMDAFSGLAIPKVPKPVTARTPKNDRQEEQVIICFGDLQLAKVTPTYNTAVCERRVEDYVSIIKTLVEIQRSDHAVRKARVYMLGDILEGELIFPHQAYQIDSGLFTQLMIDGPRITINFLRSLLTFMDEVHVVAIPGNHGQLGGPGRKMMSPESNADRMLYKFCQQALANEPRLTWQIPYAANESAWYAVDRPWGPENDTSSALCFHGNDQVPNPGSCSPGALARRIWGYASGAVTETFKSVYFGHFHVPKYIPLNDIEVFCNGSTESTNIYAQEKLSAIGQPVQLVHFTHPTRGTTAQYWVKLEKHAVRMVQTYLPQPMVYAPVPKPV